MYMMKFNIIYINWIKDTHEFFLILIYKQHNLQ